MRRQEESSVSTPDIQRCDEKMDGYKSQKGCAYGVERWRQPLCGEIVAMSRSFTDTVRALIAVATSGDISGSRRTLRSDVEGFDTWARFPEDQQEVVKSLYGLVDSHLLMRDTLNSAFSEHLRETHNLSKGKRLNPDDTGSRYLPDSAGTAARKTREALRAVKQAADEVKQGGDEEAIKAMESILEIMESDPVENKEFQKKARTLLQRSKMKIVED